METNQECGTVSSKGRLGAGTSESSSCEAPVINETTLLSRLLLDIRKTSLRMNYFSLESRKDYFKTTGFLANVAH